MALPPTPWVQFGHRELKDMAADPQLQRRLGLSNKFEVCELPWCTLAFFHGVNIQGA